MLFNYVELEPNSNLLCCICRMPFIQPVTTRTCSHTFCRDCIFKAISHARQCPVDRSALSEDDLLPANSIIRSLVDELIVECIHRDSGCTHTCQRQLLTAHIMDSCPYRRVACPKGECDEIFAGKDAESHSCVHKLAGCDLCGSQIKLEDLQRHALECTDGPVTCEFCALELSRSDLAAHNNTCPAAVIPCLHASNGCGWTGPRSDLVLSHIPVCPYEALAGFFALNNTKFARIAEENLFLRHRVEILEARAQTTQRELQSAKTALGPWYRPDGVYAYSTNTPTSVDLPPDLQPASASASRRYSQAIDAPPLFEHAPADALAAYFPAETDALERRNLPASPQSWEPPFGVSAGAGTALNPNAQHAVAPLNLSTTIEGALAGVRGSVVALGGAVDSLARRSDIALSNEARRLNEEVMSLRANVHGLRMQVHAIMMDRNAQVTGRNVNEGGNIFNPNPMNSGGDGTWPPVASGPARFYYPGPPPLPGQSITKL
ncbi:hypothetical protein DFH07DRAFT_792496 [Mycena maculata]|uniref:Uncharacterized protein n=1 Tax=Mycena maculata TaxID=230809 RepID=A0AAD7KAI3_9AGAR|nr:hypothetical protein DFH07DRAFT_792496 [Mycena maculata]